MAVDVRNALPKGEPTSSSTPEELKTEVPIIDPKSVALEQTANAPFASNEPVVDPTEAPGEGPPSDVPPEDLDPEEEVPIASGDEEDLFDAYEPPSEEVAKVMVDGPLSLEDYAKAYQDETDPIDDDEPLIEPIDPGPTYSTVDADKWAQLAHIALGENSPGVSAIASDLAYNKKELEKKVAEMESVRLNDNARSIVAQTAMGPYSDAGAEEIKLLHGKDLKVEPKGIIEKVLGREAEDKLTQLVEKARELTSDPTDSGLRPDYSVEDIADERDLRAEFMSKVIRTKTLVDELKERVSNQSFAGRSLDFIKNLSTVYKTVTLSRELNKGLKEFSFSDIFLGSNLDDQIQWLWRQPYEEFNAALEKAVDRIAEKNPALALEFAKHIADWSSYSKMGSNFETVFAAATSATGTVAGKTVFGLIGKAGRVAKKLPVPGKAAKTAEELFEPASGAAARSGDLAREADRAEELARKANGMDTPTPPAVEPSIPKVPMEETGTPVLRTLTIKRDGKLRAPSGRSGEVSRRGAREEAATRGSEEVPVIESPAATPERSAAIQATIPDATLDDFAVAANNLEETIFSRFRALFEKSRLVTEDELRAILWRGRPISNTGASELAGSINPVGVVNGNAGRWSNLFQSKFATQFQKVLNNLPALVARGPRAIRLTKDQIDIAVREALERVAKLHRFDDDRVADVMFVRPEQTVSDSGFVAIAIGGPDGKPFKTSKQAIQYASKHVPQTFRPGGLPQRFDPKDFNPRLLPGSFDIVGVNGGYHIRILEPFDEVSQAVLAAGSTSPNMGFLRGLLDFNWLQGNKAGRTFSLSGAMDRISELQRGNRMAVDSMSANLREVWIPLKKVLEDVRKFPDQERGLVAVMDYDDKVEAYRKTVSDFVGVFRQATGLTPRREVIEAYFMMVRARETELLLNNIGKFRDAVRLGLKELTVEVTDEAGNLNKVSGIHAKPVDDIPLDSTEPFGIILLQDGVAKHVWSTDPNARGAIDSLVVDASGVRRSGRIFALGDTIGKGSSQRLIDAGGGAEARYIVVDRNPAIKNLKMTPTKRREGWHRENDSRYYIKAPIIKEYQDATGRVIKTYQGDMPVMGFASKAMAQKYAEAFEKSRELYKTALDSGDLADYAAFKRFVEDETGMSASRFARIYKQNQDGITPSGITPGTPFQVVRDGVDLWDTPSFNREGIQNSFRSANNLENQINKKWSGERSEPLLSVREDPNGKPIFGKGEASVVNPIATQLNSLANLTRQYSISSYKISHANEWWKTYGHLLEDAADNQYIDPMTAIYTSKFKEGANVLELNAARASRNALLELLGSEGKNQTVRDAVLDTITDGAYTTAGQARAEKRLKFFDKNIVNVPKGLKNLNSTLTIGLLNPTQAILNLTMIPHVVALHPQYGVKAMLAAILQRQTGRDLKELEMLRRTRAVQGVDLSLTEESVLAYHRYGRNKIEGSHSFTAADMDNPVVDGTWMKSEPSLAKSLTAYITEGAKNNTKRLVEKTAVLFNETEKFGRAVAWNTSYFKWKGENPGRLPNPEQLNGIAQYADTLYGNMSRAASAGWQTTPALELATQYARFSHALAETFTSGRLTKMQKARAVAVHSAMWGLPVGIGGSFGLGAFGGGVVDLPGMIEGKLVENKVVPPQGYRNKTEIFAMSGAMGLIVNYLNGGRGAQGVHNLAPGGIMPLLNNAFEKDFITFLAGPSGNVVRNFLREVDPLLTTGVEALYGNPNTVPPRSLLNIFRVAKSWRIVDDTILMANLGIIKDKNGKTLVDDVSLTEAMIHFATGQQPARVQGQFEVAKYEKKRQDMITTTANKIRPFLERAIATAERGEDPSQDLEFLRGIKQGIGFRPEEWKTVIDKVLEKAPKQYKIQMKVLRIFGRLPSKGEEK